MPYTNLTDAYVSALVLGGVAFAPPATYYLGLSSSAPTQTQANYWSFTEPSATGGYQRLSVANTTAQFGPATPPLDSGYEVTNLLALDFGASTSAWSTGATPLGWVGLFDSAAIGSGNLWLYGQLSPTVTVNGPGIVVALSPGQLLQSVI